VIGKIVMSQAKHVARSNGADFEIENVHRDDLKHFVVHTDEKLTAFMELQAAISACQATAPPFA